MSKVKTLTRGQKAAATRAANKKKALAEIGIVIQPGTKANDMDFGKMDFSEKTDLMYFQGFSKAENQFTAQEIEAIRTMVKNNQTVTNSHEAKPFVEPSPLSAATITTVKVAELTSNVQTLLIQHNFLTEKVFVLSGAKLDTVGVGIDLKDQPLVTKLQILVDVTNNLAKCMATTLETLGVHI